MSEEMPAAPRIYSRTCPQCFAQNTPPADACSHCGAATSWASEAEFREFFIRTKREGSVAFLRAAAVLFVGMIFSMTNLVVFRELARRGYLVLCLVALAGSLAVTIYGASRMGRARRRLLFE